jgi:hypothetical protein
LQALNIFIFQGFAIAALLAIIGGMLVISGKSFVLAVICRSALSPTPSSATLLSCTRHRPRYHPR